jgi:mRNA-degrading endonuclease toxin of MazEF toxin-antitoxin module
MKRGEIWLIKLDKAKSVGHEYYNDRPALIIMADNFISAVNVVTTMPLSSNNGRRDDIIIKKDINNRLYEDSTIKVHHIISYDKSRFIHKIGEVDIKIMKEVENYIKKHFDIT